MLNGKIDSVKAWFNGKPSGAYKQTRTTHLDVSSPLFGIAIKAFERRRSGQTKTATASEAS